jgi:hypothetical protein
MFCRAAACSFADLWYEATTVAASGERLSMVKAEPFVPIVDLVLAQQDFVAECAAGGEVVLVAGGVKRPFFVNIEASVCNRLLTATTAKMFRVPIST